MVKSLFDTNILIDYLNGVPKAEQEIASSPDKAISLISWMEVMVGAADEEKSVVKAFLSQFELLPIDSAAAILAVEIRQQTNMKLPDAIILGTARATGRLLITRNTKDFPPGRDAGVRIPYQVRRTSKG
jgi:predicted nucleic acid-binding protein